MDAGKKILLDLLTGSLRFVVPVYQRRYSWGETQCRQLWADIVTAGILTEPISPGRSYGCRRAASARTASAVVCSSTVSSGSPR